MAESSIEWTEVTWNPTTGCDRISPGCDHCYALTMAKRLKSMGHAKYQNDGDPRTSGPGFGLTVHEDVLTAPLSWTTPKTVFVNSMSDLFHARVPREFLAQVFAVMAATPQHTYQILTKRPRHMRSMLNRATFPGFVAFALEDLTARRGLPMPTRAPWWPLANAWLGTSIETDDYSWRADDLRSIPAEKRFISAEPLLGPLPSLDLTGIDWLIIGGESGPGARPARWEWFHQLVEQARASNTAVFVKQTGSVLAGGGKGGDWDRWPADLRIREYPAVNRAVAA